MGFVDFLVIQHALQGLAVSFEREIGKAGGRRAETW